MGDFFVYWSPAKDTSHLSWPNNNNMSYLTIPLAKTLEVDVIGQDRHWTRGVYTYSPEWKHCVPVHMLSEILNDRPGNNKEVWNYSVFVITNELDMYKRRVVLKISPGTTIINILNFCHTVASLLFVHKEHVATVLSGNLEQLFARGHPDTCRFNCKLNLGLSVSPFSSKKKKKEGLYASC